MTPAPSDKTPNDIKAMLDDPRTDIILEIFSKETRIDRDRLTPDARIEELGVASLDMVQTVFALETRFDIEIPVVSENAGNEFATVGELLRHVLNTLDQAGVTKHGATKGGDGKDGTRLAGAT